MSRAALAVGMTATSRLFPSPGCANLLCVHSSPLQKHERSTTWWGSGTGVLRACLNVLCL